VSLYPSITFETVRPTHIQHQASRAFAFVAAMRKDACQCGHSRVEEQEAHHRAVTFREEYRRLLKSYGIEYDGRFVWD
jgi:hypothetical protein